MLIYQIINSSFSLVEVLAEIEAKRNQIDHEEDERKREFVVAQQRLEEEKVAAEIERKKTIEREATKRFEEMMKTYQQNTLQSKTIDKSKMMTPLPQRPSKPIKFVQEGFVSAKKSTIVPLSQPSTSKAAPIQKSSESVMESDGGITVEEYINVLDECEKGIQSIAVSY